MRQQVVRQTNGEWREKDYWTALVPSLTCQAGVLAYTIQPYEQHTSLTSVSCSFLMGDYGPFSVPQFPLSPFLSPT